MGSGRAVQFMGIQQKVRWMFSIRRHEHSSHWAVLIYVTLGKMPLTLDFILWSAFKSASKILLWQILCMELPYPERYRAGITPYRSYHCIYCSQKPGTSQRWGLSTRAQTEGVLLASLKFREPAASVTLSDSRLSCIHPSAQLSKHRGPSWFLGKNVPDHCTTFLLSASLSKLFIGFYCFAFLQISFNPDSAPPSQHFYCCSDTSRVILKGLTMLWTHGRRVTLLTAEGGCFLNS